MKNKYQKPKLTVKKIKFQLLYSSFDSFIDGSLLASTHQCPAECDPPPISYCEPDAYCKGSNCAC